MYYSNKTVRLIISGFVLGVLMPINMATAGTGILVTWCIMGVVVLLYLYKTGKEEAWLKRCVDQAWEEWKSTLDKYRKARYNVSDGGEQ